MIKKANKSSSDALLVAEYFRDHANHGNGQNGLQNGFPSIKWSLVGILDSIAIQFHPHRQIASFRKDKQIRIDINYIQQVCPLKCQQQIPHISCKKWP
jgi:hypothetical protein